MLKFVLFFIFIFILLKGKINVVMNKDINELWILGVFKNDIICMCIFK